MELFTVCQLLPEPIYLLLVTPDSQPDVRSMQLTNTTKECRLTRLTALAPPSFARHPPAHPPTASLSLPPTTRPPLHLPVRSLKAVSARRVSWVPKEAVRETMSLAAVYGLSAAA